METLGNIDVYVAVEEEQEFTEKLSQRQRQILLKNAELDQIRINKKKKIKKIMTNCRRKSQ